MSPLNAAIYTTTYLERQKCYGPGKKTLSVVDREFETLSGQAKTNNGSCNSSACSPLLESILSSI
jgi:hypothetical protein